LNEHKQKRDIYIRTAVYILLPPVNVRTKWILFTETCIIIYSARQLSLSWARSIQSMPPSHFLKIRL